MADLFWRDRGACRDKDPELFFPLRIADAAEAKGICIGRCDVRETCAKEALRTHTRHGVHGGFFLPDQRTSLRRFVETFEARPATPLIASTCTRCGTAIQARRKLVVCGACRAADRFQSVPAAPVREHIELLRSKGWSLTAIYTRARVAKPTVRRIMSGAELVASSVATKLLAVPDVPPAQLAVS